ncbi:hypothetical protein [Microcoleus sp. bin38.metabat.b11b12b14.051]|uniref:hypothetical protein n=1 Tax=Microcoleus sp. bin38.metabat.b11b12b14.051 TaxID=2742709 RepID=UPI0025EB980C|nr:hypothetical protein [Microcoleus sp. bin38.metabat.b11b12b14.051]
MSQKDQRPSSSSNQKPGGENENRQPGKTKTIIYLIISAFIFGAFIASGVTFLLLKGGYLALNNPTPPPIPTPTPLPTPSLVPTPTPSPTTSLVPTPTPLPTPSLVPTPTPTPTGSPNISAQPTESPQLGNEVTRQGENKNNELPGYFPNKGFTAPPSDLSRFKKVNLLLKDMVISGDNYINFVKGTILIRGKLSSPVFSLRGNTNEQRVGFQLDGSQKGLLLQLGQQDLSAGDTNLTYLVRISVDGKLLWAGECKYGPNNQIVSVPLGVPGATSVVIEYSITEQGGFYSYNFPPLYFTRAELLYQ